MSMWRTKAEVFGHTYKGWEPPKQGWCPKCHNWHTLGRDCKRSEAVSNAANDTAWRDEEREIPKSYDQRLEDRFRIMKWEVEE